MSRSRKKPYLKDGPHPNAKRRASQKVRRLSVDKTPANGAAYKKVSESWDICDFVFYWPKDPKSYRK